MGAAGKAERERGENSSYREEGEELGVLEEESRVVLDWSVDRSLTGVVLIAPRRAT